MPEPSARPTLSSDDVRVFYAVYRSPPGFPGLFAVRRVYVSRFGPRPVPDPIAGLYPTLAAARMDIPERSLCCRREKGERPELVETWY